MTSSITKVIKHIREDDLALSQSLILDAIEEGGNNLDYLFNLSIQCAESNKLNLAIEILTQLSVVLMHEPEIFYSLGFIYSRKEDDRKALFFYEKALQLNPNHNSALVNMGATLNKLLRHEEALIFLDKAVHLDPKLAESWSNKGSSLDGLMRYEEALMDYDEAIKLHPKFTTAYLNRGNTFMKLNKLDQANFNYDAAIQLDPSDVEVAWNKSLALLLNGNLELGWKGYEVRWKTAEIKNLVRTFSEPLWLGDQSLKEKTILLYAEQGMGDTIHFCRYAKLVAKLGAKVILEVQPPLVPLLKNLEGISEIVAKGQKIPDFDYQCPLLSLPLVFHTALETIPSSFRYIQSNEEKKLAWRNKLGKISVPRVGIVWSGSTIHKNDHNRSLELSKIISYLPSEYKYVCLQKDVRQADKVTLLENPHIQFYGDEMQDFADTAALCELMDLIISVDTSVAHLAGALGKPTWILLPYAPDWRWFLGRSDSPWYPSVKLYRQKSLGDWEGVLERVRGDLNRL
ncbi:hypothetical protein TUM22923_01160 [Polynucleobacter sp. TUM22923]|jgi:tetratricopeptide (TPR) repeat protein|uniref:tetratricopeptide repeat protein n=1 Tax=Polynucleobacter sp. TUM22923 TaxID=3022126 RepID=UPI002573CF81|nr:tetratricopeptide repeat protein [Polynucleobacter sp. TUM22923]BDX20795.1 hypothetical protein TUM22923_01160 [Polynucleobacter sp. TUM22923]